MITFANHAHKDQKYGSQPYSYHLERVLIFAKMFTDDEDVLCAAYGHDLIEDTTVTKKTIENIFGHQVAELIWRVTDEDGVNRSERKTKTLPKTGAHQNAVLIKLADRLANVSEGGKVDMYKKEQLELQKHLYRKGYNEKAWKMLNDKLQ